MIQESGRKYEVVQRVKARPETVFSYLTDSEKYARWQGIRAELDARPGGIFRVYFTERGWARGEYLVVDPPRRVLFTWGWEGTADFPPGIREVAPGSSTVEITLDTDGDETVIRLRHYGLPTDEAIGIHGAYWPIYMERLGIAAAGGDPGMDPVAAEGVTPL